MALAIKRKWLGRLFQAGRTVRMMSRIASSVRQDSTNQPVWKCASSTLKTSSSTPNVRKSNTDDTGPTTHMKSRMNFMSHARGCAISALSLIHI